MHRYAASTRFNVLPSIECTGPSIKAAIAFTSGSASRNYRFRRNGTEKYFDIARANQNSVTAACCSALGHL